MRNPNSAQALSDVAFQQVVNQQMAMQRDAELSVRHKIDWEAQHRMVWTECQASAVDVPPLVGHRVPAVVGHRVPGPMRDVRVLSS